VQGNHGYPTFSSVTIFTPLASDSPEAISLPLRFEDLTQDGRLVLEALPNALGSIAWRSALPRDPFIRTCFDKGIVAILTRFVVHALPGPFAASAKLEARGGHRIVLADDGRLMLDVSGDIHAPIGRTYASTPHDGERALAGQVLAEHAFTRLFAPTGKRRVTRDDLADLPPVTETRPASPAPESIATLPEGATPLEPELRLDGVPFTFGLVHTDSNMHVNSLIYLRMFEEAALRRFIELGRGAAWLGREIDIAYRKPCFAGQTMRVMQQAFTHDGRLGMVATLVPDPGDDVSREPIAHPRPHTFMRMMFEP
jgi:hypothetical protein